MRSLINIFDFQRSKSDPKRCHGGRELFVNPKRCTGFEFQTLKVPPTTPTHFSGESPSPGLQRQQNEGMGSDTPPFPTKHIRGGQA